jgi:hypothetical protein
VPGAASRDGRSFPVLLGRLDDEHVEPLRVFLENLANAQVGPSPSPWLI